MVRTQPASQHKNKTVCLLAGSKELRFFIFFNYLLFYVHNCHPSDFNLHLLLTAHIVGLGEGWGRGKE